MLNTDSGNNGTLFDNFCRFVTKFLTTLTIIGVFLLFLYHGK